MTRQQVPTQLIQEIETVRPTPPEVYVERLPTPRNKHDEHPMWDAIQDFLGRHPGSKIKQVAAAIHYHHQNANRQLAKMHKKGLVAREREGRDVYHYLPHQTALHVRLHPHLQDEKKRSVVELLLTDCKKEWNVNEISKASGICFVTVRRFLEILKTRQLVRLEKHNSQYKVKGTAHLEETYANYLDFYASWKRNLLKDAEEVE